MDGGDASPSAVLMLVALSALAAEPAVTVAYRPLLGGSLRGEVPVTEDVVLLAEGGMAEQRWRSLGVEERPVRLLRPHVRLGGDWHDDRGVVTVGPRVVAAVLFPDTGYTTLELGVQGVAGWKIVNASNVRFQMGGGVGYHTYVRLYDQRTAAMAVPVIEARVGWARSAAEP